MTVVELISALASSGLSRLTSPTTWMERSHRHTISMVHAYRSPGNRESLLLTLDLVFCVSSPQLKAWLKVGMRRGKVSTTGWTSRGPLITTFALLSSSLAPRGGHSVRGPAVLGTGEGPESRLTIYEKRKEEKLSTKLRNGSYGLYN